MSCLQKEEKPMIPVKTLDIIFRHRHVPNTQYYFTNRLPAAKDKPQLIKPSKPFRVPRSEKLLYYIKYSDRKEKMTARTRLSYPVHLKDSIKVSEKRDLSKRLYIDAPDNVRSVLEIHPEFYNVIEGRPLRGMNDIKVYVNNIRSYAMNRQQIGYRDDLIMKIEKDIVGESEAHEAISRNLKQHIKDFQKYLMDDYKKACNKVSKAEKVFKDLVAINSEFLGYVSTLTIVNNILFKLDAIRAVLKMYRKYLMFVAPISWRQQYDETLRDKIQSIQFESGVFATENDLMEATDIDKMVELAKIEFENPLPAHLYFTDPKEMMYLFCTMELQSREYLTQLSKTCVPYRMLQKRIKQLELCTKQEMEYFQYYIDFITKEIEREQYNEKHLQDKFYRILLETFHGSVASLSTLKLKICIEYVYEQIFGKCEEGHHSLQDPMKMLEIMYEDYNLRLDSLDFKIVNQARNYCFAQDLKMMKNAHKAERELKAFREMTNAMNKAFLPAKKFSRPVLKKKFAKKSHTSLSIENATDIDKQPARHKLSPEERYGLITFTEWCEGMDPETYLKEYYEYVVTTFDWMPLKSV